VRLPPPRIGEHSAGVLGRFGFTPAQIAQLFEAKVVK